MLRLCCLLLAVALAGCASSQDRAKKIAAECDALQVSENPNFYQRMSLVDIERRYGCLKTRLAADSRITSEQNWDLVSTGIAVQEALYREVAQNHMTPEQATLRWATMETQLRSVFGQRSAANASAAANSAALMNMGIMMMQQGQAYTPAAAPGMNMMRCWRAGYYVNCQY